jgi:hypothetical protein
MGTCRRDRVLRQGQRGHRFQHGRGGRRGELRGRLVPQVAVGAMRVVVPALVMPVAHHAGSEDLERDERQGNAQDLDRFSQSGFGPVQSRKVLIA